MKKIGKIFLLVLALFLVYQLGLTGYRILLAPEIEDPAHLAYKEDYLKQVQNQLASAVKPNVVLIVFDDLGYGDIGAFGSQSVSTPNLDQVASQGVKLTNYYSPAPNCTPSRAGMLTGRLPIHTSLSRVVFPRNSAIDLYQRRQGFSTRLPNDEILLPEILKHVGYSTKMVGKWHLGDIEPSLPKNFGFDDFYGLLYSNDAEPLNLYDNDTIIEKSPIDQTQLTRNYTKEAVSFIAKNKENPFFLYFAHSFPHKPLHVTPDLLGKSNGGLYGDVVEELDRSVRDVVTALRENGLEQNTLVLITSDNGPWFQGNPGFHRGRKQDTFDGGMAVPFIAYWPGSIQAGLTSEALTSGLDLVPTILDFLHIPLPEDRKIDGYSMKSLLVEAKPTDRELLIYNNEDNLWGVRDERFKYQAARPYTYGGAEIGAAGHLLVQGPWLFDLGLDPNESYDVSDRHPERFKAMQKVLEEHAASLKANPRGWEALPSAH